MPTSPVLVVIRKHKPLRGSLVWSLRCVGVIIFLILLLGLPTRRVDLVHFDLRWIGWCMLLTIAQLLLEALTWQTLLWSQRIRYPYPKTILAYLSSHYLGLVTPGHVGEFLAAGYISMDTGITFGYALSSVIMRKLLNWAVIVAFGLWGLPFLASYPFGQGVRRAFVAGVIVLVVLAAAIAIWVVSVKRLAKKWEKLSPWQIDMTELWSGMRHLLSGRLVVSLALTAASFSLLFLQLDAVLRALGISLPFALVSQIMAFSRIVGRIVPLSVIGLGTKDAVVVDLLSRQGIDFSVGLAATLLLLLCSYLLTLILSAISWWVKPIVVRRAQRV